MRWTTLGLFLALTSCGPTQQERRAQYLAPAQLRSNRAPPAGVRTVSLHVYADAEYRRGARWQKHFDAMLERANAISQIDFGVRFVVAEYSVWERDAPATELSRPLRALATQEARGDWVVGLVSASPTYTASVHQLGVASPYSRRMVMRAMDDILEYQALEDELNELPQRDRDALYLRRKEHKQAVVFLHEWAHTLTAIHSRDRGAIMHPIVSEKQYEFGWGNIELIRLGLKHAPADFGDPAAIAAWRAETLKLIATTKDRSWDPFGLAGATKAVKPRAPDPEGRLILGRVDAKAFNAAIGALNSGDAPKAWQNFAPLLARRPHIDEVQVVACEIAARLEPPRIGICEAAIEAAAESIKPIIMLAYLQLNANPEADVSALLAEARRRLKGKPTARAYELFARAALRVKAASYVVEVLADAPESDTMAQVREALSLIYRNVGMPAHPAKHKLKPEEEAGYARALRAASVLLSGDELVAAEKAALAVEAKHPGAPGALAIRCVVQIRRRRLKRAAKLCQQALVGQPEYVWPHRLLASIRAAQRRWGSARKHLTTAVELAPQAHEVWTDLARFLARRRDKKALKALRVRFEAQFKAKAPF